MDFLFDENITAVGQTVHRRQFAATLSQIAKEGADAMYKKELGRSIIEELKAQFGILEFEDFNNYSTIETQPLQISWNDYIIESPSLPSSGPVFLMAMKILENMNLSKENRTFDIERIFKALKVASFNFANLGDPKLQPDADKFVTDYMLNDTTILEAVKIVNGTDSMNDTVLDIQKSHATTVIATDSNELYVSVVSGLGSPFGSRVITSSGIVLNDAMKSFFVEEAKNQKAIGNILEPMKRPLTSYVPAFMMDKTNLCGTRLGIGSSDSSLLLEVMLKMIDLNFSVKQALEAPRFVTSFTENKIFAVQDHVENATSVEVESLTKLGFTLLPAAKPYPSINLIMKAKDDITAQTDERGGGQPRTF